MPSETSTVGPDTYPVPTGGTDSDLSDTTLLGLLDFFGYLIKQSLDAKLTEMRGPTTSDAITDACPTANRFPFNHQGSFPQRSVPSLWAWEESSKWSPEFSTLGNDAIERRIVLEYIFPQLVTPSGRQNRHGLQSAVVRTLFKYGDLKRHQSYGYNGAAAGTPIWRSLNLLFFRVEECTPGEMAPTPRPTNAQAGNTGFIVESYPAVRAVVRVVEEVEGLSLSTPDDALEDGTITISTGDVAGDLDNVTIMTRVLEGSDGTENL